MKPALRLLRLAGTQRRLFFLTILCGVGTLVSGAALSGTSAWLIAAAALMPGIAALQVAVTGVRAFGLARGLARYGERLAGHGLSMELLARLRLSLWDALEARSPAILMHRGGDLLQRLVRDSDSLRDVYVRGFHAPILAALLFFLATLVVLPLGARFGLILAAWFALGAVLLPLLFHRLARETQTRLTALRAELAARHLDLRLGCDELRLAGAWERRAGEALERSRESLRLQDRVTLLHGLRDACAGACAAAALLGIFFTAWPMVAAGLLSGTTLVALVLGSAALGEAISPVAEALVNWGAHRAAAERVFAVENEAIPVVEMPSPKCIQVPPSPPSIDFQSVTFTWPQATHPALIDLDLRIEPGEHVVLTGPSGTGKSTVLALLMRAFDPQSGVVKVDGADVRDYSFSALRATVALVSQSTWFSPGTVRENLAWAKPNANDGEMKDILEESGLRAWFAALPNGLDTELGAGEQHLSGGERQRLSLARALLRASPVLALDELSAHLDHETALALHERLAAGGRRRTILRITHDARLLSGADRVLRMEGGRLS